MKSLFGTLLLLATLSAHGATLYSQLPENPPGGTLPSQLWFDPTGNNNLDSDAIAYAAFTLSQDASISHIEWWGQSVIQGSSPPASSNGFFIAFYNQNPNTTAPQPDLPQIHGGKALARETVSNVTQTPVGNGMSLYSADLANPVNLAANIPYFLSIADSMPVAFQTWGWAQSQGTGDSTFYYQYAGSPAGGAYYSERPGGRAFTLGDATATVAGSPDCLFDWAERSYPSLFAPAGSPSVALAPYYYRNYAQTYAYLGTSTADGHVYYLGPASDNLLMDVGTLSSWLATAGCP